MLTGLAVIKDAPYTVVVGAGGKQRKDNNKTIENGEPSEFGPEGGAFLARGEAGGGANGSPLTDGIGGTAQIAADLTGAALSGANGSGNTRVAEGPEVNQGLFSSGAQRWGGGGGRGSADSQGPTAGLPGIGYAGSTFSPNSGGGGGGARTVGNQPSNPSQGGIVVIRTIPVNRDLAVSGLSTSAVNGAAFEGQPVVRVTQFGTSTPVSGVVVTAAIASSPGGSPVLQGTLTATSGADGDAVFGDLAIRGPTGDYTLSFSASGAVSITSSAISLSAGAASAGNSLITASSATVGTGQELSVTVQAKDSAGNNVTAGGDAVVLTPTAGSMGSITDNGNGTYAAIYTAPEETGVVTINGTLNGGAIGTSATVTVLGTQIVTWEPENTALTMPGATITPSVFASTSGDGAITYSVNNAGDTGCTLTSDTTPATWPIDINYITPGTCTVRATAAATGTFAAAFTDVDFVVSLASRTITASSSAARLQPGQTATVSDSVSAGGGAITWTTTTPARCTLTGTTVTATANGSCILTVTIAADGTYAAASDSITITVFTPSGGGGGGGGGSAGGGTSNGSPSNAGGSGTGGGATGAGGSGSSGGAAQSGDNVTVPGAGSTTRGRALPPPPDEVDVQPVRGGARSSVLIKQPAGVAGSQVLATVVVVRDVKGKVVSRINIELEPGQSQTRVTVPYVAEGYTVDVYNVNQVGVSTGALMRSPLVRATTITKRAADRQPSLFGTTLGRPIIFTGGSAALSARAKRQLNAIARGANARGERLFVTGFARKGGGSQGELASLSTRRANAAAQYLSRRGVRVWIRYWGAGSLNGTGSFSDRRVEVRTSANRIPRTLVP